MYHGTKVVIQPKLQEQRDMTYLFMSDVLLVTFCLDQDKY